MKPAGKECVTIRLELHEIFCLIVKIVKKIIDYLG